MKKMHEVEIELLNARAKTNILYAAMENNLPAEGNIPTLTASEMRDLLVLLSDVSGHINSIEAKLFPETEAKAA